MPRFAATGKAAVGRLAMTRLHSYDGGNDRARMPRAGKRREGDVKKSLQLGAVALALAAVVCVGGAPVAAQGIIDDWNSVKAPPPPPLKAVKVDPKTTALLLLDFLNQNCASRPRCAHTVPAVEKFAAAARKHGVLIIYSAFPPRGKADVVKALTPESGDPVVISHADKFVDTDLEKMLKDKGIKTVIATGTAANGALIYTASGAAFRGFKVVVPVDAMSSQDLYAEQYTVWHLAHASTVGQNVTLTSLAEIGF
jgi:nicotinamidase-related amidase